MIDAFWALEYDDALGRGKTSVQKILAIIIVESTFIGLRIASLSDRVNAKFQVCAGEISMRIYREKSRLKHSVRLDKGNLTQRCLFVRLD